MGKTWGAVGVTTLQKTTGNRGSVSIISAYNTGSLIFMLHHGKVKSIEVIKFLKKILRRHIKKHIVLLMDQAPVHTSGETLRFINSEKRLHIFYFPSRSPELNPHEKVWNHLKNEELKSHQAKNVKELKRIIKNKLLKMSKNPDLLKGLFYRSMLSKFLS